MKGVIEVEYTAEDPRRKVVITKCTTQTVYFEQFMRGIELQVTRNTRTDQDI